MKPDGKFPHNNNIGAKNDQCSFTVSPLIANSDTGSSGNTNNERCACAGSVEQAYRYPEETWTEAEARKHCQDHNGTFKAATKQEPDQTIQKQRHSRP